MTHPTLDVKADLHIFRLPAGQWECIGCKVARQTRYLATDAALRKHLHLHRQKGHDVPEVEL